MRYRPTAPLLLASFDINSNFGVSMAWAASTTRRAVTVRCSALQVMNCTVCTEPSLSAVSPLTTQRSQSKAPAAVALPTCTEPSYFAPMGQRGTQIELPAQGGRPSYSCELRAAGVLRTRYSIFPNFL